MKQFIYPYIMLKDSKAAADYYVNVFGGKITYTMLGKDMPNCPEDQLENVMHIQVQFNENTIYMADQALPNESNIHIHLDYQDRNELEKVYKKMIIEGTILQDLDETFWGAVYGVVKDKFNVTWQFHYTLPREKE